MEWNVGWDGMSDGIWVWMDGFEWEKWDGRGCGIEWVGMWDWIWERIWDEMWNGMCDGMWNGM